MIITFPSFCEGYDRKNIKIKKNLVWNNAVMHTRRSPNAELVTHIQPFLHIHMAVECITSQGICLILCTVRYYVEQATMVKIKTKYVMQRSSHLCVC